MSPSWLAPAKVNLGLRITGVRPDGYHELDSLFAPLDLADRLTLEVGPGGPSVAIEVEPEPGVPGDVPADERNLAARAARAFLAEAGLDAAVRIRIEKRIPSPGGLGGGSSDAGTTLRALAERFPGALDPAALARLGLSLGADVPFFVGRAGGGPEPARVRGVGERLDPCPGVPSLALALVHAGPALETARVYGEFDALAGARVYGEFDALAGAAGALTGPGSASTMPALQGPNPPDPDRWRSAEWLTQLVANDLEPAVRRLWPEVARVREALEASGAWAVGLSGSGPTLFGIFPDAPAASRALGGAELRRLVTAASGWASTAETRASPGTD